STRRWGSSPSPPTGRTRSLGPFSSSSGYRGRPIDDPEVRGRSSREASLAPERAGSVAPRPRQFPLISVETSPTGQRTNPTSARVRLYIGLDNPVRVARARAIRGAEGLQVRKGWLGARRDPHRRPRGRRRVAQLHTGQL